jgi:hypothetical protein
LCGVGVVELCGWCRVVLCGVMGFFHPSILPPSICSSVHPNIIHPSIHPSICSPARPSVLPSVRPSMWCCMVLYGVLWRCMVLYVVVWYCVLLYVVCFCLLVNILFIGVSWEKKFKRPPYTYIAKYKKWNFAVTEVHLIAGQLKKQLSFSCDINNYYYNIIIRTDKRNIS